MNVEPAADIPMRVTERVGTDLSVDQPRRSAKRSDDREASAAKQPKTAERPVIQQVLRTPPGLQQPPRARAAFDEQT
eukprot:1748678-Heterocapsa_arctica.AAC.1